MNLRATDSRKREQVKKIGFILVHSYRLRKEADKL